MVRIHRRTVQYMPLKVESINKLVTNLVTQNIKLPPEGKLNEKMGSIKDRNDMEKTEAENIKRWQEYTEELYKKDLHNPDNHDGVITDLEPDSLECEVKWAEGSITVNKAS